MSNWPSVSSLGVHLTKCQPNPTSHLTKWQSCPTSHLGGDIWSNVNLTLHLHLTKYQSDLTKSIILDGTSDQMSNWLSVSSLGVHLPKCQSNPTSDLTKCQSGPTSHLQEYIWFNANLILHLIWPNVKLALYLIFGGTSDQMLTWHYISSDQMSTWPDPKPHLGGSSDWCLTWPHTLGRAVSPISLLNYIIT